jgi:hypothetical protein
MFPRTSARIGIGQHCLVAAPDVVVDIRRAHKRLVCDHVTDWHTIALVVVGHHRGEFS